MNARLKILQIKKFDQSQMAAIMGFTLGSVLALEALLINYTPNGQASIPIVSINTVVIHHIYEGLISFLIGIYFWIYKSKESATYMFITWVFFGLAASLLIDDVAQHFLFNSPF